MRYIRALVHVARLMRSFNQVHSWFTKLVQDEDVMKATAIDIQALAKIVAQCGVAIESFSEFFYKSKFCQRTMLDIGVLRYPDLQQPYIKVECCPLL